MKQLPYPLSHDLIRMEEFVMSDISNELVLGLPTMTLAAKGAPAVWLVFPISAILIARRMAKSGSKRGGQEPRPRCWRARTRRRMRRGTRAAKIVEGVSADWADVPDLATGVEVGPMRAGIGKPRRGPSERRLALNMRRNESALWRETRSRGVARQRSFCHHLLSSCLCSRRIRHYWWANNA